MKTTPILIVVLNTSGKSPFIQLDADGRFFDCYEIGIIEEGVHKVVFDNRLNWL